MALFRPAGGAKGPAPGTPRSQTFGGERYVDKQTGDVIGADPNSPVGKSKRFQTVRKSGDPVGAGSVGGQPAFIDRGTPGAAPGRTDRPGVGTFGGTGQTGQGTTIDQIMSQFGLGSTSGLGGGAAGTPGFSGFDLSQFFQDGGFFGGSGSGESGKGDLGMSMSPEQAKNKTQNLPMGSDFGGFNLGGLDASQITPEQVAGFGLGTSLQGANLDMQDAFNNFRSTTGLLGQQTNEGLGLVGQFANIGIDQAGRERDLALGGLNIDKAEANLQYEDAVAQVQQRRGQENEFLKQKLADAGAIDSTAGVQIITRSAEKYDSILGNLMGQRNIALARFAVGESAVRNTYVNTVQNISMKAQEMTTQLVQGLQSAVLQASQTFAGAQKDARKSQMGAFSEYISAIYGIQEARKEAELAATQAAAKAQQQAFDNAVTMAGLTGTYIDPVTGEAVRTLNGLKYDDSMLGARSGSGGTVGSLTSEQIAMELPRLLDVAFANGLVDEGQYRDIVASVSGSKGEDIGAEARVWYALLNDRVAAAEGAATNPAALGGRAGGAGMPNLGGYRLPGAFQQQEKDLAFSSALSAATAKGSDKKKKRRLQELSVQYPEYATQISTQLKFFE